ncbi:MAG: hypothetical protein ACN0LA_11845 [Candidatus Longimicrobiales bacterium M2_2A_002]
MTPVTSAVIALLQEQHLTLHSVLVGIPHDAAAIVVYLISAGAIGWVFKAGLAKPDHDESEDD